MATGRVSQGSLMNPTTLTTVPETLPLPRDFRVAGVHAGIKTDPALLDMAMIVSDRPTRAAGMFTTNQVKAASVTLDIERLQTGVARAVIVNSGNANACTGPQGVADARRMAELTAELLGVPEDEVLVSSTGTIGKPLDMPVIEAGIAKLHAALQSDDAMLAAKGILTTDTRAKVAMREIELGGKPVRLTGICKGAGMIEPNMATMLCYVISDAAIEPQALRTSLKEAVDRSFNRISIDGDTSTNDSVIALANGAAENVSLTEDSDEYAVWMEALRDLIFDLAMMIVLDGEGMTKFVELNVTGARDDKEADVAARAVANSFLVKTGWAGTYPVWGRIIDVIGYCPAHIEPEKVSMNYGDVVIMENGMAKDADKEAVTALAAQSPLRIGIDLGTGGSGAATIYTCDCTEEYVRINMF